VFGRVWGCRRSVLDSTCARGQQHAQNSSGPGLRRCCGPNSTSHIAQAGAHAVSVESPGCRRRRPSEPCFNGRSRGAAEVLEADIRVAGSARINRQGKCQTSVRRPFRTRLRCHALICSSNPLACRQSHCFTCRESMRWSIVGTRGYLVYPISRRAPDEQVEGYRGRCSSVSHSWGDV